MAFKDLLAYLAGSQRWSRTGSSGPRDRCVYQRLNRPRATAMLTSNLATWYPCPGARAQRLGAWQLVVVTRNRQGSNGMHWCKVEAVRPGIQGVERAARVGVWRRQKL